MAPSGRRWRGKRRTQFKKKLVRPKNQEKGDLSKIEQAMDHDDFEGINHDQVITSGCSTPKAERFRIPDILTCPPAPKKQRVISNSSLLRRSPITFYTPPELEVFFVFALGDIPV